MTLDGPTLCFVTMKILTIKYLLGRIKQNCSTQIVCFKIREWKLFELLQIIQYLLPNNYNDVKFNTKNIAIGCNIFHG